MLPARLHWRKPPSEAVWQAFAGELAEAARECRGTVHEVQMDAPQDCQERILSIALANGWEVTIVPVHTTGITEEEWIAATQACCGLEPGEQRCQYMLRYG